MLMVLEWCRDRYVTFKSFSHAGFQFQSQHDYSASIIGRVTIYQEPPAQHTAETPQWRLSRPSTCSFQILPNQPCDTRSPVLPPADLHRQQSETNCTNGQGKAKAVVHVNVNAIFTQFQRLHCEMHGLIRPYIQPYITVANLPLSPKLFQAWVPSVPSLRFRCLAIKDNIVTTSFPTTCGSQLLQDYQSPFGAWVTPAVNKRYTVPVTGKTKLDEFGMGSHSQNSSSGSVVFEFGGESLSPGGSSGGSAIAVAYPTVEGVVAFGTDTGGSVRLPAAYTGVVGFKPSYGILSRHGVVPYANSLDTVGILARDVGAAASLFSLSGGCDTRDPSTLSQESRDRAHKVRAEARPGKRGADQLDTDSLSVLSKYQQSGFCGMRIGVPVEYNIKELAPEVKQAWHEALWLLEQQGCTIVPISLPNTKHALSAYYVIAPAEASSNLAKYDGVRYGTRRGQSDAIGKVLYSHTRGSFGEEVKRRILLGSYTLSSDAIDNYFIKAQKVRRLVQRDFDRVFAIPNPLRDSTQFDLSDMDESILLQDKLGPSQVDLIVCPTTPTTSPTLESLSKQTPVDSYMNDVFTVPASLAGLPAISIPFNKLAKSSGIDKPIGIQIIGQYLDDVQVLAVAEKLVTLQSFNSPKEESTHELEETRLPVPTSHFEGHSGHPGVDPKLPIRQVVGNPPRGIWGVRYHGDGPYYWPKGWVKRNLRNLLPRFRPVKKGYPRRGRPSFRRWKVRGRTSRKIIPEVSSTLAKWEDNLSGGESKP
ncbi:hypothetical protein HYFRA_00000050 [Hymenoscyphus fraxineus]|uniref:Glutamyl-tRNA(Gln) amidotransferase subunit A, mitochondrial n=1 Tax=Hymenoscyphus fraxineus TaxID=746836 RepID=A0A9N9L074_9HELO|nr:hypothetical protein HYFRA_00000050 [Hymenoscyphus fraxineus]